MSPPFIPTVYPHRLSPPFNGDAGLVDSSTPLSSGRNVELGEDVLDDVPVNVSQAEVTPLILVSELFVVNAH